MSTTNPLLFLEAHTPDIKAQYRQANPDRYRKFKPFLEELTAMARTLSRNKGSLESITKKAQELCTDFSLKNKRLARFWLFKAFDNEILHYHILQYLTGKDKKEREEENQRRRNRKSATIKKDNFPLPVSPLTHPRNEEIFKKKWGLSKCASYIEKRKFLETCAGEYLEKYSLLLNVPNGQPVKDNVPDNKPGNVLDATPDINDRQFYKELYHITLKELALLDKQEKTRLYEDNHHAYFIHEDIIGQLNNILVNDWLADRDDERALWQLLRFGSSLGRKIKLNMSAAQLAHSFYQLAEANLITKHSPKELTEWLYVSFEPRFRGGKEKPFMPDTLRRYLTKRKGQETGQEIFWVRKVRGTKNSPRYILEKAYS